MTNTDAKFGLPIFDEPPDDIGQGKFDFGLLLVGEGAIKGIEIARAFRDAAERLLECALDRRESWEAAYPILFCYRHALEAYLKALIPNAPKKHGLINLWAAVRDKFAGDYRRDQLLWIEDRIKEFHLLDPNSTGFRYHDTKFDPASYEQWVDFGNLKKTMALVFEALERVHLAGLQSGGAP